MIWLAWRKMLSFGNTTCAAQIAARPKSSFPFYEKLSTYVSPMVSVCRRSPEASNWFSPFGTETPWWTFLYLITDSLEFKSFNGDDQDFRKMLFEHINYLRMSSREWFSLKSRHASEHKVQLYKKKLDPKNLESLGIEDFSFCLSEELPYGQEMQIMDKLQHIFGTTKTIPREFAHLLE